MSKNPSESVTATFMALAKLAEQMGYILDEVKMVQMPVAKFRATAEVRIRSHNSYAKESVLDVAGRLSGK